LETEHRFETCDGQLLFFEVFLLAGCLDKPAQALVQNIGEGTGAYGCGKCLIAGMMHLRK